MKYLASLVTIAATASLVYALPAPLDGRSTNVDSLFTTPTFPTGGDGKPEDSTNEIVLWCREVDERKLDQVEERSTNVDPIFLVPTLPDGKLNSDEVVGPIWRREDDEKRSTNLDAIYIVPTRPGDKELSVPIWRREVKERATTVDSAFIVPVNDKSNSVIWSRDDGERETSVDFLFIEQPKVREPESKAAAIVW